MWIEPRRRVDRSISLLRVNLRFHALLYLCSLFYSYLLFIRSGGENRRSINKVDLTWVIWQRSWACSNERACYPPRPE